MLRASDDSDDAMMIMADVPAYFGVCDPVYIVVVQNGFTG
jgi:hypothetical protein